MPDETPHTNGDRRSPAPRRDRAGATPRLIRSDRVRYPGVDGRVGDDAEYRRWLESGQRLRPARDTGLQVEGRRARERRRGARKQWVRVLAIAAGAVALVALGVMWRASSDRLAAQQAPAARRASSPPGVEEARAAKPAPTPLFANYYSLELRLPVAVTALTEVGFHQASYNYALHMDTPLETADMGDAKRYRSTKRDPSAQKPGDDAVLVGQVLRMWRDRPGEPDSAVDIGADPGTPVVSPVDGTVVLVKEYDLYGKFPDIQIHIQPDGYPTVDVVLIHVERPVVQAGTRVIAGVTPLAKIRRLSDKIGSLQLRSYTKNGGNHVHLQLNNAKHPEYEGLEGAIKVGEN